MIVILDNIRSALNVGSILRTCDALDICEVWFCGITPDPDNEKVKKTSLGAESKIRCVTFITVLDAIDEVRRKNLELVALEITPDAIDLNKVGPRDNFALIVGNEISGVAQEALDAADLVVKIPMLGTKESMNVSVAFGIAAYVLKGQENT